MIYIKIKQKLKKGVYEMKICWGVGVEIVIWEGGGGRGHHKPRSSTNVYTTQYTETEGETLEQKGEGVQDGGRGGYKT